MWIFDKDPELLVIFTYIIGAWQMPNKWMNEGMND